MMRVFGIRIQTYCDREVRGERRDPFGCVVEGMRGRCRDQTTQSELFETFGFFLCLYEKRQEGDTYCY